MKEIRKLLGNPVVYYPKLVKITGNINSAIMLHQLMYWWERRKGEHVHKTFDEFNKETALARRQQINATKRLIEAGYITVKVIGIPPIRHFKVITENILCDLIKELEKNETCDMNGTKCANSEAQKVQNKNTETCDLNCTKPANKSARNGTNLYTEITTKTTTENTPKNTSDILFCENRISQHQKNSDSIKNDQNLTSESKASQEKTNPPGSLPDQPRLVARQAGGEPPLDKKQSLHIVLKSVFIERHKELSGLDYYWTGKDGKHLKELIGKIRFLMESQNQVISGTAISEQFQVILENIQDTWVLENFSVSVVNSKFNEIIMKIKKQNESVATSKECCTSEAYKREVYARLLGKQM